MQLADRLFLAMARKADDADGDLAGALYGNLAPWLEAVPNAEQAPDSIPDSDDEMLAPTEACLPTPISILDRVFADIGDDSNDLTDLGGY